MKVVDNRKNEGIKMFAQIKIGETFCKTSSNTVFMRTDNVDEMYDDGLEKSYHMIANAISLNSGHLAKFTTYENVIPLNCECVIKEA